MKLDSFSGGAGQYAAKVLVEGRNVAVDVGEVSGRYFLLWAGYEVIRNPGAACGAVQGFSWV